MTKFTEMRYSIVGYICFTFQVPQSAVIAKRSYSVEPPLSFEQIRDRVLLVLQLYDKVDPIKVYF